MGLIFVQIYPSQENMLIGFLISNNFLLSRWFSIGRNGRKLPLFRSHDSAQYTLLYLPTFSCFSLPEELVDQIFEKNPILEKICKFIFHPIIAGLAFTLIFSFWHIGAFYESSNSG